MSLNKLAKINTTYPRRGKDIYEYVEGLLSIPNNNPPAHIAAPSNTIETISDIALILCNFGNDEKRRNANHRALQWTLVSKPKPFITIVDAQLENEAFHYTTYADEDVIVINKTITDASKGLFLKEALWNIGAKYILDNKPNINKLVFMDMDCEFVDQMWASVVSDSLDQHDCISPHIASYYANADDNWPKGLIASVGYNQTLETPQYGFQGLAFACTKDFYVNRLNSEFKLLSSGAGDTYLWYDIVGSSSITLSPNSIVQRYAPDRDKSGMLPKPKVGHGYQIIAHIDHGGKKGRNYQQKLSLAKRCLSNNFEDYEINEQGIPVWSDNVSGTLMSRLLPKIFEQNMSIQETMLAYEQEAVDIYGAITPTYPLIITCLLRSGGTYSERHVRWLKQQLDKYCQVPFKFICQSDIPIKDIKTIPLELSLEQARGSSSQVEHYRNIWPDKASVLTCDLDTVICRPFLPHRCPSDRFFMMREYGITNAGAGAIWNGGLTYFRGDFSYIYENYLAHINGTYHQQPRYIYQGAQEFMVATLRMNNVIPEDIEPHFCYRYWNGHKQNYEAAAILSFPGHPKPWDIKKHRLIPALPEDQGVNHGC